MRRIGRNQRKRRGRRPPWWRRMVGADDADRVIAGVVAIVALAVVVWAAVELMETSDSSPIVLVDGAAAAEMRREPVAFHRIMPEAADDLGRPVILDGTVEATAESGGIWVRDLRGYTVYVAEAKGVDLWSLAAGDPVRVRGRIALLSGKAVERRLDTMERRLDAGALLVRGVQIMPGPGGIRKLRP